MRYRVTMVNEVSGGEASFLIHTTPDATIADILAVVADTRRQLKLWGYVMFEALPLA